MKKKEGCIIMKATERFYLCEHCGNMAGLIHDAGVPMMCCGQPMKHLVANTTDAATEKHVPAVTIEGNTLKVHVKLLIQCWKNIIFNGFIFKQKMADKESLCIQMKLRKQHSLLSMTLL